MIKIVSVGHNRIRFDIFKARSRWFTEAGGRCVKTARAEMLKPKSGRVYLNERRGRNITRSAIGEAPAVDSGALYKSVRYETRGNQMYFGAGSSRVDYAADLETGGRAFIQPAVQSNWKNIEQAGIRAIADNLSSYRKG